MAARTIRLSPLRTEGARVGRLVGILCLLQSGSGWTAPRLAAHFHVSRRRLFEDIHLLNVSGFPIVADRGGYRPLRPDLQVPVVLQPHDLLSLLRPTESDSPDLRAARAKLAQGLPEPLRRLFRVPERVMSAPSLSPVPARVQEAVDAALASRRRLRIVYRGLKDATRRSRVVEPHGLFMKGSGWYLVAWCRASGDFRRFRLDRISSCEDSGEVFEPQPGFDLAAHVADGLGVWQGRPLQAKVRVQLSHVTALASEASARSLPFHRDATGATLEIPRGHPDEVAWWLAQFGEGIRVVDPPELRVRLRRVAEEILRLNAE